MPVYCLKFRKALGLGLILALLPAVVAGAQSQQAKTKTFVVIGTSPIFKENVSAARDKAIANSLAEAVALMAGEILEVESMVGNFQLLNALLYDNTGNFIQDYKVLAEANAGKYYRVMVQATVAGQKVARRLSKSGILRTAQSLPAVLFMLAEQNVPDAFPRYWWGKDMPAFKSVAAGAMVDAFREKGFKIVDHRGARVQNRAEQAGVDKPDLNAGEAAGVGRSFNANVVISGTAVASAVPNTMGGEVRSFKATVSVHAVRADTGEEIASVTRSAVATSADENAGGVEALAGAGALAGQVLAGQLAEAWQKQAGQPTAIEMVVEGTGRLANFVKFRRALNSIAGVKGVQVKEIQPDVTTLVVDYDGKAKDLGAALMLKTFDSFGINIYEITPGHMKIALIPG